MLHNEVVQARPGLEGLWDASECMDVASIDSLNHNHGSLLPSPFIFIFFQIRNITIST